MGTPITTPAMVEAKPGQKLDQKDFRKMPSSLTCRLSDDVLVWLTTQVTGPVRRVHAPYWVRWICWFDVYIETWYPSPTIFFIVIIPSDRVVNT